ncbi:N-acetylglutamate kinase [Belliella baltica DSM 15883]|uniref:Acetylglutamate kinase n=1 Tax=Belliella baltica (strain DSM 15883 / CIP 108006 / LMG 21964 / BA134) TaxID=866536 RepID=I3Z429_BELBD|nr:acetylglutamate kinase [Belliella baltica]AFL83997.1 N-acetylglutamate kinase [Belliella baltica DSM 15883]
MQPATLLIKYGGNAMINQELKLQIASALNTLKLAGHKIVLVHGGGPFINKALEKAQITSEFIEGQRQTNAEALFEIQKTLIGEVNADLVQLFSNNNLSAVGLSGLDAGMVQVEKKILSRKNASGELDNIDLGRVGQVKKVDSSLIQSLLSNHYTPVIACIGADESGIAYNVNADDFAGEIASALHADYYISLTDVDGLYENYPDPASLISTIPLEDLPKLYGSIIQGGMIPKIQSCELALKKGVKNALIINGTKPEQLLDFFEKNIRLGTTITQ